MKRAHAILVLILGAACSGSSTLGQSSAGRQGAENPEVSQAEPGNDEDDYGEEGDAGVDCIFNRGRPRVVERSHGWREVASLSTIGQAADGPTQTLWTGHELIAYGEGVAASYEPRSDTWKGLPNPPIGSPAQRTPNVIELAGTTKLVVWGGGSRISAYERDGAVFDLCTKTWSAIPPAPIIGRNASSHAFATTTNELVIWGGNRSSTSLSDPNPGPTGGTPDGAAFSLTTGEWRMIANPTPAPGRYLFPGFYASTWTGTSMLMYGGGPNHGAAPSAGDVFLYDPVLDRWTIGPRPTIQPRQFSGWQSLATRTGAATFFGGTAVRLPVEFPSDGATWDFTTDTWSIVPAPVPILENPSRFGEALFWLDDRLHVWGGTSFETIGTSVDAIAHASGAVFDPKSGSWSPMLPGGPTSDGGVSIDGYPIRHYLFATTMDHEAFVWGNSMMIYRE